MEKDAIIRNLSDENTRLKAKTDNRKKLSKRDVALIRRFAKTAGVTHQELADSFEVNRATISRIISGEYHKED
ncbi:hypothetical protein SAMN05421776_11734 [Nocardia farcinica]|uniref:HTH cro/C1-type domain-containing protein n=2 Tax=Actinomycetota TaxID=201174 RepID=A0A0H5PB46_NOCFR|nr:hypothetical protein CJ469_05641 [Nocardia farcinica]PFX06079.1 hypothetical protein CJ468_04939 [Nocardia farcinica]CRY79826.1 Uncharacterised protein [Nocardia farcinica]SIT33605.1 hypothetical protein SAMN05421776_11734 [Nocardia farcinica]